MESLRDPSRLALSSTSGRRWSTWSILATLGLFLGCTRTDGSSVDHGDRPGSTTESPPEAAPTDGRLPKGVEPLGYTLELRVDPDEKTFQGSVKIRFRTDAPRRSVFLHARDLSVKSARLTSGSHTSPASTTPIADKSLLRIDSSVRLEAGEHTVEIAYEAPFAADLAGLYRVKTDHGHYVFTQFEPLDARRAFPCFDEPGFKTPFDVTMIVKKEHAALANARAVEETPDGAFKRVRFATTEKLPTYLIAFAVGPLDIVEAPPIPPNAVRKTPIPLRGAAVRGRGAQLAEALKEHARLVAELEAYFRIPYPYDKLDIIAVPDFAAGAMENAGAITYREALLLLDPKTATETQRRDMVEVAAHELAHQWFGNLVTMAWWDDLWLNEAFATWMSERVVSPMYPDWNLDLELMTWVQGAMETDSLASARKIRQKIATNDDIENAFDDLTYSKGAGIISMFERFVGPEVFRAGVRRYLEDHRFGSATTEQFMAAVLDGQKPEIASAFVQFLDRAGVPRVTIDTTCKGTSLQSITVQAERYVPLGSTADPKSDWLLPLCVKTGKDSICGVVATKTGAPVALPIGTAAPCPASTFPNADGAAYLRYTPTAPQLETLMSSFTTLTPRERLAAVDAVRAGFRAGTLDASSTLGALPKVMDDPVRQIAFAPTSLLSFVSGYLVTDEVRPAFSSFAARLYEPRLKKVGWEPKAGAKEPADAKLTRKESLSGMLFVANDRAARERALRLARAWLGVGTEAKPDAFDSELLQSILTVGVQDGGAPVFDALVARFEKTEDAVVRRAMLGALARATDPKLAARARALTLGTSVRSGERLRYVFDLFSTTESRDGAWTWLSQHLGEVIQVVPESVRGYLPLVVESLCDDARADPAKALFAPHLKNMTGAPRSLDNALEKMHICSAQRAHHAAGVVTFLKKKR